MDARLKERLLGMAARKSSVMRNGRFYYSKELNAFTYWYEDHTQSTRMVYLEAELDLFPRGPRDRPLRR